MTSDVWKSGHDYVFFLVGRSIIISVVIGDRYLNDDVFHTRKLERDSLVIRSSLISIKETVLSGCPSVKISVLFAALAVIIGRSF